ncbi:MAG: 16S rRNA (guanine(527)-N(7))-methyltransferase RsmG [Magnetococcales bacterium]|nr:16S rRNA (guanine(527)-N(7))-methyltransferase RsmG [Magnetococcales bacterium]
MIHSPELLKAWWREAGAAWAEDALFRQRLSLYLQALCEWNQSFNLTGCKSFADLLSRHVQDVALLQEVLPPSCGPCVDIGSGAGLPGLVLAMMHDAPPWLLIESNQKKIRFLRHVVQHLQLAHVSIYPDRAESPPNQWVGRCDAVTSRAVGSLTLMAKLAFPYLRRGGSCLAMKGEDHPAEIQRYLEKPLPGYSAPELLPLAPRSWVVRLTRFT